MNNKIINTTLTAIFALTMTQSPLADNANGKPAKLQKGLEKCYGIAKAGMNDCAYAANSCAGASTQDGEKGAWLYLPKGTCNKIVNGTTIPPKKSE